MDAKMEVRRYQRLYDYTVRSLDGLRDTIRSQQQLSLWLFGIAGAGLGVIVTQLGESSLGFGPNDLRFLGYVVKATAAALLVSMVCGAVYYARTNAVLALANNEKDCLFDIYEMKLARSEGTATEHDGEASENQRASWTPQGRASRPPPRGW